MITYRIKTLCVRHSTEWKRWPDTEDRDYSRVVDSKFRLDQVFGDTRIILEGTVLPAFYPRAAAGEVSKGEYPCINNTKLPGQKTLDMWKACLAQQ